MEVLMMDFKDKCKILEDNGLTYLEIADVLDSEYNIVRLTLDN